MSKLRISIVEFLNTAPLVWGFTDGPLAGRYDLSFAVPSQCAEDLKAGRADVGIIPAIEYQRMENGVALPGMAVAAKNEVRSILVVSKVPIDQARTFALDTNSRSSVGLVRVLCQRHWDIAPEFIDWRPDADEMLGRADAALIIGDPALRLRLKVDALEAKVPQGKDFQASREYGLAHIGEIAEGAALKLDLPPRALERYLTENIDFSLDEENLAGLKLYYQECARAGLIPRVRELEFAGTVNAAQQKVAG